MVANRGTYGKLRPVYIAVVVLTLIIYYVQIPIEIAFHGTGTLLNFFKILSAILVFCSALAYVTYGVLLWKKILKKRSNDDLFFRIFVSALVTAIFFIIICLVIFITRVYSSTSFRSYIIRHSIYETCYFAQIAAVPSGFIVHFAKTKSFKTKEPKLRSQSNPMEVVNLRASGEPMTFTTTA